MVSSKEYLDFILEQLSGLSSVTSRAIMDEYYFAANGCENDFSETRLHHEIYLSDARKVAREKWKTVIRHPVRKR